MLGYEPKLVDCEQAVQRGRLDLDENRILQRQRDAAEHECEHGRGELYLRNPPGHAPQQEHLGEQRHDQHDGCEVDVAQVVRADARVRRDVLFDLAAPQVEGGRVRQLAREHDG